jgi:hypothetical protein
MYDYPNIEALFQDMEVMELLKGIENGVMNLLNKTNFG